MIRSKLIEERDNGGERSETMKPTWQGSPHGSNLPKPPLPGLLQSRNDLQMANARPGKGVVGSLKGFFTLLCSQELLP